MEKTISTNQFTYDSKTNTFIGEMSEVERDIETGFLKPDCIYLKSEKTGTIVKFIENRKEYKGGEFISVTYLPAREEIKKNSKLDNCEMVIFND